MLQGGQSPTDMQGAASGASGSWIDDSDAFAVYDVSRVR